jgi:hypothetical protein
VLPQVDRRLDGFPGRSDVAGIMFLHEKLDLFRKAQWIELLGIRTGPADILISRHVRAERILSHRAD